MFILFRLVIILQIFSMLYRLRKNSQKWRQVTTHNKISNVK